MAANRIKRLARAARSEPASPGGPGAGGDGQSGTDSGPDQPFGDAHEYAEPAGTLGASDNGRKPGRPAGSRNGSGKRTRKRRRNGNAGGSERGEAAPRKVSSQAVGSGTLEKLLLKGQNFLTSLTKIDGLEIPPDEFAELSDALTEFRAHHEISVLSDKRASEFMLAGVVLAIYGPRILLLIARYRGTRPQPAQRQAGPVQTAQADVPDQVAPAGSWFEPTADQRLN